MWLDKTPMDYVNWDLDQPDDDSYGEIRTGDGMWRAGRSHYDRPYVCETPKGKTLLYILYSKEDYSDLIAYQWLSLFSHSIVFILTVYTRKTKLSN